MKVAQIIEALSPSQYRPLVKNWDKERYKDIFMNPKYKHDKNGYRVFIPIGEASDNDTVSQTQHQIAYALEEIGYTIDNYVKGIAISKRTDQPIKIGKLLTKIGNTELLNKFNTDDSRAGKKNEYIVIISRHPYDIAGMSTDRGWTSCMNLKDGEMNSYVPLDVEHGSVIAYVTKKNDINLKNPTGRVLIKPFIDIGGSNYIEFGIEDKVYGTTVPRFLDAVNEWVNTVNNNNDLDDVVALGRNPSLYDDSIDDEYQELKYDDNDDLIYPDASDSFNIKGGSLTDRGMMRRVIDNPVSIKNIDNPSEKFILAAISQRPSVIQYIEPQTEKMQLTAVANASDALRYIKDPSEKVTKAAITRWKTAIEYADNPSDEMQMLSVKNSPDSIRYIKNPCEAAQIHAVSHNNRAYRYIMKHNPSEKVKMAAVTKRPENIQYMSNPSLSLQKVAMEIEPETINFIDTPAPEIQMAAVTYSANYIKYIKNPIEKAQLAAIRSNPRLIIFISEPTEKAQLTALKADPKVMFMIDNPTDAAKEYARKMTT